MMSRFVTATILIALGFGAQLARAETSIKFVMDWVFDGPQAIWTVAGQSTCFPDKGLNVSIDRGYGSGDTITKIAAGAYDIGVADFGTIVAYNAQHPDNKITVVLIVSDLSATAVSDRKSVV